MSNNLVIDIEEQYPFLSPKEKNIALYILMHKDEIKNMKSSDLAKKTKTSPATITRFANKLNCDGFIDMKIKLSAYSSEVYEEKEVGMLSDVYSFYATIINNTIKSLKLEKVDQIVNTIKSSKKIYVYGIGSSAHTANEFSHRLLRMGLTAAAITDSHLTLINSAVLNEHDLIIAISNTGSTKDLNNALLIAKEKKAMLVAITNTGNSPIAEICDLVLFVYNGNLFMEEKRFINNQISLVFLIDVISTLLLEDDKLNDTMNLTVELIEKNS